jgi:hypothetical protein
LKSTSVFKLAFEQKKLYTAKRVKVIMEIASESPLPINMKCTKESQLWIFSKQISTDIEAIAKYDIVISDRTCVDSIGYTMLAGFKNTANGMIELARDHIKIYDKIIFKTIENNPYHFSDGIRDDNIKFRNDAQKYILEAYEILGIKDKLILE